MLPRSDKPELDLAVFFISLILCFISFVWIPQNQLALNHSDPQWYTIVTAAYAHIDAGHMISNILGYLLAASYTYWLSLYTDRREWF